MTSVIQNFKNICVCPVLRLSACRCELVFLGALGLHEVVSSVHGVSVARCGTSPLVTRVSPASLCVKCLRPFENGH